MKFVFKIRPKVRALSLLLVLSSFAAMAQNGPPPPGQNGDATDFSSAQLAKNSKMLGSVLNRMQGARQGCSLITDADMKTVTHLLTASTQKERNPSPESANCAAANNASLAALDSVYAIYENQKLPGAAGSWTAQQEGPYDTASSVTQGTPVAPSYNMAAATMLPTNVWLLRAQLSAVEKATNAASCKSDLISSLALVSSLTAAFYPGAGFAMGEIGGIGLRMLKKVKFGPKEKSIASETSQIVAKMNLCMAQEKMKEARSLACTGMAKKVPIDVPGGGNNTSVQTITGLGPNDRKTSMELLAETLNIEKSAIGWDESTAKKINQDFQIVSNSLSKIDPDAVPGKTDLLNDSSSRNTLITEFKKIDETLQCKKRDQIWKTSKTGLALLKELSDRDEMLKAVCDEISPMEGLLENKFLFGRNTDPQLSQFPDPDELEKQRQAMNAQRKKVFDTLKSTFHTELFRDLTGEANDLSHNASPFQQEIKNPYFFSQVMQEAYENFPTDEAAKNLLSQFKNDRNTKTFCQQISCLWSKGQDSDLAKTTPADHLKSINAYSPFDPPNFSSDNSGAQAGQTSGVSQIAKICEKLEVTPPITCDLSCVPQDIACQFGIASCKRNKAGHDASEPHSENSSDPNSNSSH